MQRSFFAYLCAILPLAGSLALVSIAHPLTAQTSPLPPKISNTGVFKDGAGVSHSWQITPAHTLVWDNAPYLPVGGAFTPHSLRSDSEVLWQEDTKALETL